MLRREIQKDIAKMTKKIFSADLSVEEIILERPRGNHEGHYATNICMMKAGELSNSPLVIAEKLKSGLEALEKYEKVSIAKPGFLNLVLSAEYLSKGLVGIKKMQELMKVSQPQKILLEYGSENIAKPMSVGHLRSNIIGQSMYNIYQFLGHEVMSDNHIGDWGTQFGKLIYAYRQWGSGKDASDYTISELVALYQRFQEEASTDEELTERAREESKKLEEGDVENRKLWQMFIDISLKEFQEMYQMLGVKHDTMLGESFFENMLVGVIEECLANKIAYEKDGAVVVNFPEETKLPSTLIRKSDGVSLYLTRDIATVEYRVKKYQPDMMIYFVDQAQELHFKQLFWVVTKLGYKCKYIHSKHGAVSLDGERMSTRRGHVVALRDAINQTVKHAREIIDEKGFVLKEAVKNEVARKIGVGSLIYNDLSQNKTSNIDFTWEKALSFEGNTAPYLQYSYARARSIIRKYEEGTSTTVADMSVKTGEDASINIKNHDEQELLLSMLEFVPAVKSAGREIRPNILANALYNMTSEFNHFYHALPVLKADAKDVRRRMLLVKMFSEVLEEGLGLLGIDVVEKM